jgi:hypothetical protein
VTAKVTRTPPCRSSPSTVFRFDPGSVDGSHSRGRSTYAASTTMMRITHGAMRRQVIRPIGSFRSWRAGSRAHGSAHAADTKHAARGGGPRNYRCARRLAATQRPAWLRPLRIAS